MNIINKGVKRLIVRDTLVQPFVYMELHQPWELYQKEKLQRASHCRSEIYDFITKATMKNFEQGKSRVGLCYREVATGRTGWKSERSQARRSVLKL